MFIIKNILLFTLGIGDWGLGIGDWGLGPIPNPQSPIPNPPIPKLNLNNLFLIIKNKYIYYIYKKDNINTIL